MELKLAKKAIKDLEKLSKVEAKRILVAMQDLKDFPDSTNIKKLSHFKPSFRKRVGNYRVLFEVEENVVKIYRIVHRKDAYEG